MAAANVPPSMVPFFSRVTTLKPIHTKLSVTSGPVLVNKFLRSYTPSSLLSSSIAPNLSTLTHQEININPMYGSNQDMYGKSKQQI